VNVPAVDGCAPPKFCTAIKGSVVDVPDWASYNTP
jgi:hypothetical protein